MKLGFGLMRLPRSGDDRIDIEQVKAMVDRFIAAGGTYFDTAYVYDGSEEAIRKALVERYPRNAYTLATKCNAWLGCHSREEARQQIQTSLVRTGLQYFDYYLLHSIRDSNVQIYDDYALWDHIRDLKAAGLVKRCGFSFHDQPALLDELLTKHPEVDFVQLQINYADWNNPDVASRENYETARRHGKPIVVMEPVKGGILADLPAAFSEPFQTYAPDASLASWAIRYVASLDGILAVLSGMSSIEQMDDNLSYMKEFSPLSAEEQSLVREVQRRLGESGTIPCTSCKYCMPGCPRGIAIPKIFGAYNLYQIYRRMDLARRNYMMLTQTSSPASSCVQCGQCEGACPQHLPIINNLKKAAELFE